MVVDLVAEVGRLVDRRSQCEQEIASIDARLASVRQALGGILPDRVHPVNHRQRVRFGGAETRSRIFSALEKCEPLTSPHLIRETGIQSAGVVASNMWRQGLLCRRADKRGVGRYGSYWYARTEAAFDGHPDCVDTPCAPPANGDGASEDGDSAAAG